MKALKKIIIIIFAIFLLGGIGCHLYYKNSLQAVSKEKSKEITFIIKSGTASKDVVYNLYDAGLIKNKITGLIYLKLHKNINIQAGTYLLSKQMSFPEIMKKMSAGKVLDDSISLTFVEGKRLTYYAKVISENYDYDYEEIIKVWQDKTYLKELISKYWFLTDEILNDNLYYALEGYLYPNTYQVAKKATIKEITEKILDYTSIELKKYENEISHNSLSIHEILTMASIVELEGSHSNDRKGIAGVFYNRLNNGWTLGSDVTTYYAAQIDFTERELLQTEIDDANYYNTRSSTMAGKLPIGPICNPSIDSIVAALEPTKHNYFYFVADKNKKTIYATTNEEHISNIQKLKEQGLWYEYE